MCFNYEAYQHYQPASHPLTLLFVLLCPRCYRASNGNYLLPNVLAARFKIHTQCNHYSHYPNWRLILPARTPACAPLGGHCQPGQMAGAVPRLYVASLDSLRQSGSFHNPSLLPSMANTLRNQTKHKCRDEDKRQIVLGSPLFVITTFNPARQYAHNYWISIMWCLVDVNIDLSKISNVVLWCLSGYPKTCRSILSLKLYLNICLWTNAI